MTIFPLYTFIKCEEIVNISIEEIFRFLIRKKYWESKRKRNIHSCPGFSFHYWWWYIEEIGSIIFIIFHILCAKIKAHLHVNVIQPCKFFLRYIFLFSFHPLFDMSLVFWYFYWWFIWCLYINLYIRWIP